MQTRNIRRKSFKIRETQLQCHEDNTITTNDKEEKVHDFKNKITNTAQIHDTVDSNTNTTDENHTLTSNSTTTFSSSSICTSNQTMTSDDNNDDNHEMTDSLSVSTTDNNISSNFNSHKHKHEHDDNNQTCKHPKSKMTPTLHKVKIKAKPKRSEIDLSNMTLEIQTLTSAQIKNLQSSTTKKHTKNHNKYILYRIPSSLQRSTIYQETAAAIAIKEALALPSHGGRNWKVQVTIYDAIGGGGTASSNDYNVTPTTTSSTNAHNSQTTRSRSSKHSIQQILSQKELKSIQNKSITKKNKDALKYKLSSPLFRLYRGRLELACLPHILDQVDVVDIHHGTLKSVIQELDELTQQQTHQQFFHQQSVFLLPEKSTDLTTRQISALSTMAWNDRDHAIPTIERKWTSPDHMHFRTRNAAIQHVAILMERDTLIDKVLFGFGARGGMLRPVKPTKKIALEAGFARFIRDGLWIIGQEEDWIEGRIEEWYDDGKKETHTSKKKRQLNDIEEVDVEQMNDDQKHQIQDIPNSYNDRYTDNSETSIQSHTTHKKSQNTPQFVPSQHWRLSHEQITICSEAVISHFEKVMHTVKARALFSELADGFDVLRERGRGRYDMQIPSFDTPRFNFLTDLKHASWMPVVKRILGPDVTLVHKGAFLSLPGSDTQIYHQDGPHLTTKFQRDCHAINVFIPLVDLNEKNGPTEFCLGSHILGFDYYAKDMTDTPLVTAGTPIIFDYRLGHRGMGNGSDQSRPIIYLTYTSSTNEFRDSVNFSKKRYRKLGEILEKPLSRDERLKLRNSK